MHTTEVVLIPIARSEWEQAWSRQTHALALQCIHCECYFQSERVAEESPCPARLEAPDQDSGVDSWITTRQAEGEQVWMYGFKGVGHVDFWNDLSLQLYYLPPAQANDGFEGEGYYAGSDPTEPVVIIDSRARREPRVKMQPRPKSYLSPELEALRRKLARRATTEVKAFQWRLYVAYATQIQADRQQMIREMVLWFTAHRLEVL